MLQRVKFTTTKFLPHITIIGSVDTISRDGPDNLNPPIYCESY